MPKKTNVEAQKFTVEPKKELKDFIFSLSEENKIKNSPNIIILSLSKEDYESIKGNIKEMKARSEAGRASVDYALTVFADAFDKLFK